MIVTTFVLVVAIPSVLYIVLSSRWADQHLRQLCEQQLSDKLGTEVQIKKLDLNIFGRLNIDSVIVRDDYGEIALFVGAIRARAEMSDLLIRRKIILDYAVVRDVNLKLYKYTLESPLNVANILSNLTPGSTDNKTEFDLRINNISLSNAIASYDVLDVEPTPGHFNPHHIRIEDIETEIFAPRISSDGYRLWLRTFRCRESSDLEITNISAETDITANHLSVTSAVVSMPHSELFFGDITIPITSLNDLGDIGVSIPVRLSLVDASHIYLPDLSALVGELDNLDYDVKVGLDIEGVISDLDIERLIVSDSDNRVKIDINGKVTGLPDLASIHTDGLHFDVETRPSSVLTSLSMPRNPIPANVERILATLSNADIYGVVKGGLENSDITIRVSTDLGNTDIKGTVNKVSRGHDIDIDIDIDTLQLNRLINNDQLGRLTAHLSTKGHLWRSGFDGTADAYISSLQYQGYNYHDIKLSGTLSQAGVLASLISTDHNADIDATMAYYRVDGRTSINVNAEIQSLCPDSLNLTDKYPGHTFTTDLKMIYDGVDLDNATANIALKNLRYTDNAGEGLRIDSICVSADNTTDFGYISIESDCLNAILEGEIRPSRIRSEAMDMASVIVPAFASPDEQTGLSTPISSKADTKVSDNVTKHNDFTYEINVKDAETLCAFLHLPVYVVGNGEISGYVNGYDGKMLVMADMPWLQQGNKLIEGTIAKVNIDSSEDGLSAYACTRMPTIKGPMELTTTIDGHHGVLHTAIDWNIQRERPLGGNINFDTSLVRESDDTLYTIVDIKPGKIDFGDDVWLIQPTTISGTADHIKIDEFTILANGQSLKIDGVVGKSSTDLLTVAINNFNLVNIFETLGIYNALIGGNATGDIYGAALLSPDRKIDCNNLQIRNVSYNYCVLGDADAHAWFDNESQTFRFKLKIDDGTGRLSYVDGGIAPSTQQLDLIFDADGIKAGFMRPFVAAFSSDVDGRLSGHAQLSGTFSDLDMEGDIYADSIRLKIDIINVWYNATDSIHIRPGRISLDGIKITDDYGNAATLKGYIGHKQFHDAVFDIAVTDARNILCFNVTKEQSPTWHGHIFGSGRASVVGKPGHVDISANMSTSSGSQFTFELSDFEDVSEYSFITFRDVTDRPNRKKYFDEPERVTYLRNLATNQSSDQPTTYKMDIAVDVTPTAKLNLVMDPVGGDEIQASGEGHMRLTYDSASDDMRLYGTYTLEDGDYNFTLQDIIIKNFYILQGSSITFNGDPYNATLDINAYYPVSASLTDLDESFLTDNELNGKTVPVWAMVNITGNMQQPDLNFDLKFPTLNEDIYRKVKSIVSTEEMMNKQIIYLLALNRFYTPEYMSATRGNELFSVASSTIASQLSSMLGKLSDKWSIAPNLRSDKGDFSDVEVNVNLSSRLLNNRLLLNGNFGYRDKSLNTNQFVGDFDVEYLLSQSGMWRLKAYNRYNDQNYYLRTAQTTQGLGLVYRKDFDNIFGFLHRRKQEDTPIIIQDNITIDEVTDTDDNTKQE